MKSSLLYVSMFLIILCLPFSGDENEIRWLWSDLIEVPVTLLCTSLTCIALYLFQKESTQKRTKNGAKPSLKSKRL